MVKLDFLESTFHGGPESLLNKGHVSVNHMNIVFRTALSQQYLTILA